MRICPAARRVLVIGMLALASRGLAQNAFVASEDGRFRLVKEIRHGHPLVEADGKLTASYSRKFALLKATAYRQEFVTVPKFTVQTHHLVGIGTGVRINYELEIRGSAKSDVALEKCFFVLELMSENDTTVTFAEMPNLKAGKEEEFSLVFRLQTPLEEGRYALHFFSDGVELLHSKMPPPYLEAQKQKTQDFWSGQKQDFRAILSRPVRAVYPREFKGQALEGQVKVKCRINVQGDVESAEIVECIYPAFAEPALAAVRQWKFDPAVKDGRLVESTEIVPLRIRPPDQGKSKP